MRFDYGREGLRARGQPVAVPPGMKTLPNNLGVECLAATPGAGRSEAALVAISERGLDAKGTSWASSSAGHWQAGSR